MGHPNVANCPRHLFAVAALTAALGVWGTQPSAGAAVREFASPILTYPTGLAAAPDGAIWIASTYADKLVRFDPSTGQTREVALPLRTHPVGLLVDRRGAVWFAGSGLGLVGRLEPGSTKAKEFAIPSMLTARFAIPSPWALAMDARSDEVWFTVQSDGIVGRVGARAEPVRKGFRVREVKLGEPSTRPNGIIADGRGGIWVTELGADRLARIDAAEGSIRRVQLPPGSRPSGLAVAPDGTIWVALFGSHRLLSVDPSSVRTRTWPMPSGSESSPYAVAVDRTGAVWVSEFVGNAVTRFDPRTGRFTTLSLPTPRSGVRALAVDGKGRVWFVGSYSGRLGVIE